MIESRLHHQLLALASLQRRVQMRRRLTTVCAGVAAAGLVLWLGHAFMGWNVQTARWLVFVGGLMVVGIVWQHERRRPLDLHAVAAAIERDHPEVRPLISTAVEQTPDPASRDFNFLQLRVIEHALGHPTRAAWEQKLRRESRSAVAAQVACLAALVAVFWLPLGPLHWRFLPGGAWSGEEVKVTPGDTRVERGTGLVVTARFGITPPADATLVVVSASGAIKRYPMARQLADPVFGASLPVISEAGLYRVEYGTSKTRDFKIGVFDYPALTRADAALQFPAYTGLTNQTILDTLRVSAVEGTRLTYTLQLNQPVVSARFVGASNSLSLAVRTNAMAVLEQLNLTNSARYTLELVNAEGRTNKFPTEFSLVALPDRPPEVKVVFPHGDQRVSSLQELELEGEARGQFGLLNYGFGYGAAGKEPQMVTLGKPIAANVKAQFTNEIAMESLGVTEDQVVSYFAWADDHGPDGRVRRTFSDVFFAEVRPFEEIFRPDQAGGSGNQEQNQGQGQGQGGNQNTRLAEMQKQIVIATWKLQQEKSGAGSANQP
jgi:hypothetical protein